MFAGKRKNFFCKTDFFLIYCTRWERLPIGQGETAFLHRSLSRVCTTKCKNSTTNLADKAISKNFFSMLPPMHLFVGPKQVLGSEGESLLLKNGSLALKSASLALKSHFNRVIYLCHTRACINAFIGRKNVSILHRRDVTR